MASTGEETPSGTNADQIQEVKEIKEEFQSECRVIADIGDFSHIIEVKLPDYKGVHVAFQLEDTYPVTAANVIVKSKRLSPEAVQDLAIHLASYTEKHAGQPIMGKTILRANKWLEQHPELAESGGCTSYFDDTKKVAVKPQRKANRKAKQKQQQEKQLQEEGEDQKKPPMKTAMDVVSRILWDETLHVEDFQIGYLDRMLGVVEKDFDAFSWEDIASVDYHTLAIPKHRIQYFKYKGVVVWDKRTRLDDVFGSTGGKTISDVVEEYQKAHGGEGVVDNQADNGNNDEDSDDDGIEIDTGDQASSGAAKDNFNDNGASTDVWKESEDESYWGPKKRPTHFLALRVTDPEIVASVAHAHERMHDIDSAYDDCVIPTERLHVTLACLGLDTKKDVDNASNVLENLKQELSANWEPQDMSVVFNDVGNFFHSVLYAVVEHNENFMKFVHHLRTAVQTEGVEIRDVFEFTPHMTLMKLKRSGRDALRTRYLDHRFYTELSGKRFGSQIVDNIYLCDMADVRQDDGFYTSPTHISFP